MAITRLGFFGVFTTDRGPIGPKTEAGLPPYGTAIEFFSTWQPTYGGASVLVIRAETTEHAPIFADPLLTTPLPNPQVLLSFTGADGTVYGKWAQPVYTYVPYRLTIDDTSPTPVVRPPLYEIDGQDASAALAASQRGARLRTIADIIDADVYAEAFGSLAEANGAEANTAVLEAAIGAAAAQGAGVVRLPAGRIIFTSLALPQGVILQGQGMGATTLTTTFGGVAITFGGDGAGLRDLTLDGINLASSSIGLYAVGLVALAFDHVTVKRFEQGIVFRGISAAVWRMLYVSDCVTGVDLRGDTDPSDTGNGGDVRNITWQGGGVSLCTTAGLKITFFDSLVEGVTLLGLEVIDNLGEGIVLNGARNVVIGDGGIIRAAEGLRAVVIQDDSNLAMRALNTTDHITFRNTIADTGTWVFNGTCASVTLARCDLRGVSLDASVPDETIVLDNCIEDATTTLTGDTTKIMRAFITDDLQVVGNTTDAVPTVAWSLSMEPGQVGFYEGAVVAQQQDGIKHGMWLVATGAYRPGATLAFNLQTDNFTAGAVTEGATSGATARIMAVTQSAGSGTMTLGDISGTFINGEVLTDDAGGAARVDGTLSTSNAALDGGGNTDVRAPATTGTYDAYWDVSGAKVRLVVVGDTGEAVQWTARVRRLDS